jgi:hypothetical protein
MEPVVVVKTNGVEEAKPQPTRRVAEYKRALGIICRD